VKKVTGQIEEEEEGEEREEFCPSTIPSPFFFFLSFLFF